jgi:pilus assembly protein CpaC
MYARNHDGFSAILASMVCVLLVCVLLVCVSKGYAQQRLLPPTPSPSQFVVQIGSQDERIQMVMGTTRTLELPVAINELLPGDRQILEVEPIGKRQIRVRAKQPGVTQIDLWDIDNKEYNVEVLVTGDARKLKATLELLFPEASIRVTPLERSVVLWGHVNSSEQLDKIVRVAQDYYPDVINNITVAGSQTVLLEVKIIEVSRTKLRRLGYDMAVFTGNDGVSSNAAGSISAISLDNLVDGGYGSRVSIGNVTNPFGITNNSTQYLGFLDALRQYNVAKILSEPNLVAESGRAASFGSGGEFPILIPQSLGTNSVEYREFGTRVDFVPIVKGNGYIRLEVYPTVSEIDAGRSVTLGSTDVPALRTRYANTAVTMKNGQTLAIAGLMQNRIEGVNSGTPWLADMPIIGKAFRRVEYRENEIELLIMVTPHLVTALEPHEVPDGGPGMHTGVPSNKELYEKGWLEVPHCCTDGACASCQSGQTQRVGEGPRKSQIAAAANNATTPSTTRRRSPQLIGPVGYEKVR